MGPTITLVLSLAEDLSRLLDNTSDGRIRLDGADTPLLHAVDAGDESRLSIGARVRPRWAEEPTGGITDLACFELED